MGSAANPKIMVVEDDDHIARLLHFMLERQGYEVTLCPDGRVAQEHLRKAEALPEAVLMDVMLPYVQGLELVREIRADANWQKVPIIMLTAKGTETDIVSALDAGANDYVVKPFQPNELMARLRRLARAPQA